MKTCIWCKETKPLSEYHRQGDGHRKGCKSCRKSRGHYKTKRYKDGHYTVYYLPEHHYVGMTNCVKNRMQEHRRGGKLTNGFEIIGTYNRAVDAHFVETFFHSIDYIGFNYKERKK